MISLPKIFAVALVVSSAVIAALSPQEIVDNLHTLTAEVESMTNTAKYINIVNAALVIAGQGPVADLVTRYEIYSGHATAFDNKLKGSAEVTDEDEVQSIVDAFKEHGRVHESVLNVLIDKAGILEKAPIVGYPVATILKQIKDVEDVIIVDLEEVVVGQALDIEVAGGSLLSTFDLAISRYEALKL